MAEIVTFKGVRGGLELRLDGNESFEIICEHLERKLASSSAFFNAGLEVTIICETRDLDEEEQSKLRSMLKECELEVKEIVRETPAFTPEKTNRIFAILSTDEENADEIVEEAEMQEQEEQILAVEERNIFSDKVQEPTEEEIKLFSSDPTLMEAGEEEGSTFVYRKTLRNGQTISYPGIVIVVGDINPGAEIIAGSDVIIQGTCRGVISAGMPDNRNATITATKLMATQIRIADVIARSPDGRMKPEYSERALIKDGRITIEKV